MPLESLFLSHRSTSRYQQTLTINSATSRSATSKQKSHKPRTTAGSSHMRQPNQTLRLTDMPDVIIQEIASNLKSADVKNLHESLNIKKYLPFNTTEHLKLKPTSDFIRQYLYGSGKETDRIKAHFTPKVSIALPEDISDTQLKQLHEKVFFKIVEELDLKQCKNLTSNSFLTLTQLPQLRKLAYGGRLRRGNIASLSCMTNLEEFSLHNHRQGSIPLANELRQLKNIKKLGLHLGSGIDQNIAEEFRYLPKLESLHLGKSQIHDTHSFLYIYNLTQLKSLTFGPPSIHLRQRILVGGIRVPGLIHLKYLDIRQTTLSRDSKQTHISPEILYGITQLAPNITTLKMSCLELDKLNDQTRQQLKANLAPVRHLHLEQTSLEDAYGMHHNLSFFSKQLSSFTLSNPRQHQGKTRDYGVDLKTLQKLGQFTHLKKLELKAPINITTEILFETVKTEPNKRHLKKVKTDQMILSDFIKYIRIPSITDMRLFLVMTSKAILKSKPTIKVSDFHHLCHLHLKVSCIMSDEQKRGFVEGNASLQSYSLNSHQRL